MSELSFVLKSLLLSFILVICMQAKISNITIENHAYMWLETSSVPLYIQEVAQGGAVVIRKATSSAVDFVSGVFGHKNIGNEMQKAGRLNLQIKRSDDYIKSLPDKTSN